MQLFGDFTLRGCGQAREPVKVPFALGERRAGEGSVAKIGLSR